MLLLRVRPNWAAAFAVPGTGDLRTRAAPDTSTLTSAPLTSLSSPWALPPLSHPPLLPLPSPMTAPWPAPKTCQLEFLLPEIIGNGLWNGGGLLSVICLSLLICPLLIGGWTWINPTNSSAFLFFPSHLLSLLLLCTVHLLTHPPLALPAQVKKQSIHKNNAFSQSVNQSYKLKPYSQQTIKVRKCMCTKLDVTTTFIKVCILLEKGWRAWEEIYLGMGANCKFSVHLLF